MAFIIAILLLLLGAGCSRGPRDYVDRGNQFFKDGKYEDASIQYRRAIQADQAFGEAYYRLGLSEIHRNNPADAYQSLSRAVALMPGDEQSKVKLADVCLAIYLTDTRNVAFYKQVMDISGQLLAKNSNSFDGLRLKGLLALSDKKPREAAEHLQKARQIDPANLDVLIGLVQAWIGDNQFAAGENLALEMIAKDKTFGPAYDVLYSQYSAAGRAEDAEKILKSKVANNPRRANYVLELAEHYVRANKPAEMAGTLQRLLDRPRLFPGGRLIVGDFYAKESKWDLALQVFEEGERTLPPQKRLYQKRIVNALQAQGKTAQALEKADALFKEDPKDQEARSMRAILLIESRKAENLDLALPELAALVKDNQNDPVLRFNFGRAYALKDNFDAARTQFQEAIRRSRGYNAPRFALAVVYLNQRKPHDALGIAKELLASDGSNVQAKLLYAGALTETGNYSEARTQLTQILKQSPTHREAQLQLGLVAIGQKQFKEAEQIFGKLHNAQGEDMQAAMGLVNTYSAQSQLAKALQLLGDDLKKSPNSTAIRGLLARTAVHARQYDLAMAEYQKLASQLPNSAVPRIALAHVYSQKGDIDNAIIMLEQAVQAEPKNAAARAYLASILVKRGRLGEAKKRYREVFALQPDNPDVLNDLAFILAETRDNMDEALTLVQRANAKSPNSTAFKDTLGWIYFKRNQTDSALQVFNALAKSEPENPTFRYHLGAALLQKGDKPRARAELLAALDKKPSQGDEASIRQLLASAQ